ncbi:response regulator transcription factor [Ensifer sp. HO-A22]|uniref:Response regulator transcription factor n=1 Tax=Ensifer oleiphilus TaxID=2742698 RepID=A0A7Y6Q7P7_9HYPH|nr:response regulator transcription factor [Ensifer oleiphilus]NVD40569.1 response regulator transcription factor [Ensifer oleiphilus]
MSVPCARVLLVEDDNELREGLAEYLRLNGIEVVEANCGTAFHRAMRAERFDVAILDLNLPDANGFELAASLSPDRTRPGVIMLTARTRPADRIRGYAEGADLYMTKPVAGQELLLAVRNLVCRIRAFETATQEAVRQPRRLNVRMRRLTAPNGRNIELTGRETLLVEQFAGLDGKPVSRHVLADAMKYGTQSAESRGLDAALRRLRQKIIDAGLEPPVVGIQNIGIRFTDTLALT